MTDPEFDRLLGNIANNEESARLSERYLVIPGHSRYELFGCHRSLEGPLGERFRRVVIRTADMVNLDRGLLAVNAVAEHDVSIYLALREVESQEVGLDYWHTLQHSVLGSGIAGVGRIRARRVSGRIFRNEQGRSMPVYAFSDGANALLAFAALLKVYDNRISAAGGPSSTKITRFALVRYAYNASPQRAVELAARAAGGIEVLPTRGPAGPSHPLRTATVRAVQAVAVAEDFFQ